MTLSDVLKEFGNRDFEVIEYRKVYSIDSDDVDALGGFAAYKNKSLLSMDGDNYHLNDQISKYELYKPNWLVVWRA